MLEKELTLIAKLSYADYFLTVHDIVRFARESEKKDDKDPRPILCQGRGSAANSAVCFVLGVTSVDPEHSSLLFERFMSEERKEPPDIDIDFEHERREEVIQDVFERYGRHRAALTATVISYRPRSAIREVGKVFGLTEDVTAALAGTVWGSYGESVENQQVLQADYEAENTTIAMAVALTNRLIGFPRHLSQHVGGFVLARERLDELIPIGNAAMEDRTFIEWDKDDIDALGIMKVDVLALGMLTCIRKAFDLIGQYDRKNLTLADVPREDPEVYEMLCNADSIGVFQVESRAQMSMLPRLKPREFYDLVIEVAIVRPGPIQGNMVNPYLKRRCGDEPVSYPSPSPEHGPKEELEFVLKRTMGVPLFQEQAMQLAITAARFTPDEANGLRRAMATFRNLGTIYQFQHKFIEGMVSRGYERAFAESCFKQIEGFGSYGFPESHAASFAQLVYISSWLKHRHPAAFACALLNSQPMGFYAPAEIVQDARNHQVEVRPVDISFSGWDSTLEIESGVPKLRLGFRQIGGMNEEVAKSIVQARRNGFFDLSDLKRRAKVPQRQLVVLAEADAFRSLGLDRREALWAVRRIPDAKTLPLFADEEELPPDTTAPLPIMPLSEHVVADYQSIRLSLKGHPMQFLRDDFAQEGTRSCAGVKEGSDGELATCAGIVLVRQQPGSAKGTVFVTLSDETGITNVVIWPKIMERYRKEVMGARLLQVEGRIQRSKDDVVHLVAEHMTDRSGEILRLSDSFRAPPRPEHNARRHPRNVRVMPKSRDFH
jgi:error-prone DNA polymerase